MHPRRVIRLAACELLKAHPKLKEQLDDRIFPSREEHFLEEDLPAIGVYTVNETAEDTSDRRPKPDWRILTLVVEILVKANEELDDKIDELCEYAEESLGREDNFTAIIKALKLMDPILDLNYSSTTIDFASDGKRLMGLATLEYQIKYAMPKPPDELPDFLRAGTNWPNGNDEINVRE